MKNLILFILLTLTAKLSYSQCYELVWSDDFNYTGFPDANNWQNETGAGGWGNNEWQYYTSGRSQNCRVEDSCLIIEARKENYGGSSYTSARLITYYDHKYWQYGKVEARMKLPYGKGIWPAFWMLGKSLFEGSNWPACGEIDIMELIGGGEGKDDKIYGTPHWADASNQHAMYGGNYQLPTGTFADTFHVFSIEWTAAYIKWYMDGIQYHVIDITPSALSEFQKPFFIILNLAVGGNWPGYPDGTNVFPQKMYVDYVRVYQKPTLSISGDNLVDSNSVGLTFSVSTSDTLIYNWSVPEGAEIIDGQGTDSIQVNWGITSGDVKCIVTTPCGDINLKFPVQVDLHSNIEQAYKEAPKIFPTLASDRLFIGNIRENRKFSIFNCLGYIELNGLASPDTPIDITSLDPGTYFIQFQDIGLLPVKFLKINNN